MEGLKTLDMLTTIQKHPRLFEPLFCGTVQQMTALAFEEIFHIEKRDVGTNRRSVEERLITYWRDFLQDCEGYINFLRKSLLVNHVEKFTRSKSTLTMRTDRFHSQLYLGDRSKEGCMMYVSEWISVWMHVRVHAWNVHHTFFLSNSVLRFISFENYSIRGKCVQIYLSKCITNVKDRTCKMAALCIQEVSNTLYSRYWVQGIANWPHWGIGTNADDSIVVWDCPIDQRGNALAVCHKCIGKAQLHCPGIGRNADGWADVLVSVVWVPLYMLESPVLGCRLTFSRAGNFDVKT